MGIPTAVPITGGGGFFLPWHWVMRHLIPIAALATAYIIPAVALADLDPYGIDGFTNAVVSVDRGDERTFYRLSRQGTNHWETMASIVVDLRKPCLVDEGFFRGISGKDTVMVSIPNDTPSETRVVDGEDGWRVVTEMWEGWRRTHPRNSYYNYLGLRDVKPILKDKSSGMAAYFDWPQGDAAAEEGHSPKPKTRIFALARYTKWMVVARITMDGEGEHREIWEFARWNPTQEDIRAELKRVMEEVRKEREGKEKK